MTTVEPKQLLVVVRHSPYGSSLARASLDVALAAAAFEQPVKLLFMGDGVLQLLPGQDSQAIGQKNIGRLLLVWTKYEFFTCPRGLEHRKTNPFPFNVTCKIFSRIAGFYKGLLDFAAVRRPNKKFCF